MRDFRRILSIGACVVAVVGTVGCQSTPAADSPETETVTETVPEPNPDTGTAEPLAPAETEAPEPEAAQESAEEWAMPNVVGMVLQDAQDQLQSLTGGGVLYTASHDLTGKDRNQVLDANWQVCTQNIAPGAPITSLSRIDFGAVKIDENCP